MTRSRWIVLVVILLVALFAVVVGGFLWPRPQFRRGPWMGEGATPADSIEERAGDPPSPAAAPR